MESRPSPKALLAASVRDGMLVLDVKTLNLLSNRCWFFSRPALLAAALVLACNALAQSRTRTELTFPDLPGWVTLRADFHSHTVFSDGSVWPGVRVEEAWRTGLDVIAVTDHIEYTPHKADLPVLPTAVGNRPRQRGTAGPHRGPRRGNHARRTARPPGRPVPDKRHRPRPERLPGRHPQCGRAGRLPVLGASGLETARPQVRLVCRARRVPEQRVAAWHRDCQR